jgi:hypothetical protein
LETADPRIALRLALEVCGDANEVLYDVTAVVVDGFPPAMDFTAYARSFNWDGEERLAKIVVLTEGSSDSAILRDSLTLLYPHLADYYSFVDFDVARLGGGASTLVTIVKAFAGAGIVNRTIAIFDNDTAGAVAMRSLSPDTLPPSIRVMRLPEVDSLRTYPTLGPTGDVEMNVSGVAASLELYLGEDVLRNALGRLTPVQWTGFEEGIRRYQGSVLDKRAIQERFARKLDRARDDPSVTTRPEWSDLRAIFAALFRAFEDVDRQNIVEAEQSWSVSGDSQRDLTGS